MECTIVQMRMQEAAPFFMVREDDTGSVVGFINGTLSTSQELTHESMGKHESSGETLCVHSVVTREDQRRAGIGTEMLRAYIAYIRAQQPCVKSIALICKEILKGFYAGCGFELIGPSPVVHGVDQWFEMRLRC